MSRLHVELSAGRPPELKASSAMTSTEACAEVMGGGPDAIDITSRDVGRHGWAITGTLWIEQPGSAAVQQRPLEA